MTNADRVAKIRAHTTAGEWETAAAELRLLLSPGLPYLEMARVQRLVDQTAAKVPGRLRRVKIAILSSSTTALWTPLLRSLCWRDHIAAEFYEGLFGAYQQEVLDPASGLHAFAPDIIVLAVNWRDLALPQFNGNAEVAAAPWIELWERIAARLPAHLIMTAFDRPSQEPGGTLAWSQLGGRDRVIQAVNELLLNACKGRAVSLVDTQRLAMETGWSRWADVPLWHKAKQHPGLDALPAFSEAVVAQVRAVLGLTRKVVVCDLDNTLWGGIIGEDGLDSIRIGPGTAEGEAHQALQQYLKDLTTRGILLAVNSKNNLEDALAPFEKHPGMVLRREDFASFQANWTDKASNLKAIAQELSLGSDSFVFLDDNPIEREWVRSCMPEVAVPDPGSNVYGFIPALERGRYCEAITLSAEDRQRANQYRQEAQRKERERSAGSVEEFLASLGMQARAERATPASLDRLTQLCNKTNQFNLTTRRYTKANMEEMAANGWVCGFSLRDSFGDYGVIGCLVALPVAGEPTCWDIDTWLMSCRVLGRQMEQYMFDELVLAATSAGVQELRGRYIPTAKNGLVREHYAKLGFETLATEEGGAAQYRFLVPPQWARRAVFVNQGQQ
ncbi:methoxymalonyl-ACP biosynthesis protein FkbH (plasmid) [Bryobacterales bacterium F-183]|nr:methoxymalonyl-ACP biosynthesis protein FkbH [Bryobacterales bacterium F-183]